MSEPVSADAPGQEANPARKAAWRAVYSLSLGVFALVTAEFLPVSLLTPMAADLGASNGIVGQTMTVTALVAALAGPLLVLLGDDDRARPAAGAVGGRSASDVDDRGRRHVHAYVIDDIHAAWPREP